MHAPLECLSRSIDALKGQGRSDAHDAVALTVQVNMLRDFAITARPIVETVPMVGDGAAGASAPEKSDKEMTLHDMKSSNVMTKREKALQLVSMFLWINLAYSSERLFTF